MQDSCSYLDDWKTLRQLIDQVPFHHIACGLAIIREATLLQAKNGGFILMFARLFRIAFLFLITPGLIASPGARAAEPDGSAGRGQKMLENYFRRQVQQIADACLSDVKTKEDWERKRPELRRQFLEMMGLWPLPPRTELSPVVTGKVATERFTIEKLHFQSSPGLYVTANLYVPKLTTFPAPAVLYVCG